MLLCLLYLQFLFQGTIEDYKLLEKMNTLTMNKYSDMKHIALSISGALKELNEKCKYSLFEIKLLSTTW